MLCSAISWKRRERVCVVILHAGICIINHTTDHSYYPAAVKIRSVSCNQLTLRCVCNKLTFNIPVLFFIKE